MKTRDGGQALQVLHRERQRTVHHAVDHETVVLRIDIRQEGATRCRPVVERGWRDHSDLILKRARHMKDEAEGIGGRPTPVRYAYGGHEMGAITIGNQILVAPDHRWVIVIWCLCTRSRCLGARRRYRSQGQTASQRGALFEEFPSIKSLRTHRSLLRKYEGCGDSRGREYTPVSRRTIRLPRVGLAAAIGLRPSVCCPGATVGHEPAFQQALHPLFRAVGTLTHAHAASAVSPDDGRAGGCAIWAAGGTRTHAGDV